MSNLTNHTQLSPTQEKRLVDALIEQARVKIENGAANLYIVRLTDEEKEELAWHLEWDEEVGERTAKCYHNLAKQTMETDE